MSYRVFNLETNTVVESCDVTFNETAPFSHDVFDCAVDKKMEESIFVNEKLQGVDDDDDDDDDDDPLRPSTSSPEHVSAFTLEAEAPQTTTSSTAAVESSWVEGRSSLSGPSRVRSIGGKWYVIVIIDDYSRYFWVFFIESKDEVFEHF
jgi:hypothetical protein